MDKIIAKGMRFLACHGVLPEEKLHAQLFIVDLELYKNLQKAGLSDDLRDTVSYAEVYERVEKVMEGESHDLIESLAEKVAIVLLQEFPLLGVKVSIGKPQAPVEGNFSYFAVEIERFM